MTCNEVRNELLEAKAMFCGAGIGLKGAVLKKIQAKLKRLRCCTDDTEDVCSIEITGLLYDEESITIIYNANEALFVGLSLTENGYTQELKCRENTGQYTNAVFATFIKGNGVTATLQASKDNLATICDNRTTICATASFITIVTNEEVNSVGDDVVIPPPNNVPACDGTLQYIFLYNEAVVGAILDPNTGDLTIPAQLIQVPLEYIIYVTCNGLVIATVRYVFTNPTTTTTTSTTTTTTTSTTTTTTEEVTTTTTSTTTEEVTTTTSTTTTSTTSTSTTTVEELPLRLLFNDIANAPVVDPTVVAQWNTFFDLPTNGTVFTSVSVTGDEVKLFGATSVQLKDALFLTNTDLVRVNDEANCVVYAGAQCFEGCSSATTFVFPVLAMIGGGCFAGCNSVDVFSFPSLQTYSGNLIFLNCTSATTFDFPSLTTDLGVQNYNGCTSATLFNLPLCTAFGSTTGDDGMFLNIIGNTITINVPASLATINSGSPDGDLVYLLANNPLSTINYI